MSWFFNPNDWLGRHPGICLMLILFLIGLAGAI